MSSRDCYAETGTNIKRCATSIRYSVRARSLRTTTWKAFHHEERLGHGRPIRFAPAGGSHPARKRARVARDPGQHPRAGRTPVRDVELVNRQVLEYFGQTLEELGQWGTNDTVHPDDLPHVIEAFSRSIASGTPYDISQRFRRSDGVYRWFDKQRHGDRSVPQPLDRERHHGRLWAEPNNGPGVTFSFSIPRDPENVSDAAPVMGHL
jgi:PAS domain-containing protein